MAEPQRPPGGEAVRGDIDAATRLFLASGRNIPIRLTTAGVIAAAGLPVLPIWIPVVWWGLIGLSSVIELRLGAAVRRGMRLAMWEGVPIPAVASSMGTGWLYIGYMALLWATGDPVARFFAMAQTAISMFYVLLQYYARPRLFILTGTPYFAGLAAGAIDPAARRQGRHAWTILPPPPLWACCAISSSWAAASSPPRATRCARPGARRRSAASPPRPPTRPRAPFWPP